MTATDNFENNREGLESPANGAFAITPHDTNELSLVTRGIYVGGAGDAVCVMADDTEVTFTGLLAGQVYPFQVKQVKATNTTATSLIGLV